ncbi:MAG: HisA/HisF-related TIM barrel protein, partial [Candidatus Nezhaarchaeales archaeon]
TDSVYGTCNPLDLALKFAADGFKTIYIADLDSILGHEINERIFNCLKKLNLKIIADIGVNNEVKLEEAIRLADHPVIATETIPSLGFLCCALRECGGKAFLSLDMRGRAVISAAAEMAGLSIEEASRLLREVGVQKVILIDFNRIGVYSGPNIDDAKYLVECGFDVYVGGGIRSLEDIITLDRIGVSGVLIGSALHSGRIKAEDLKYLGFI